MSSSMADPDGLVYVSMAQLLQLEFPARQLDFRNSQPHSSLLAGRHGSRLRGRGLNFEELRRTPLATAWTMPRSRVHITMIRSVSPRFWVRKTIALSRKDLFVDSAELTLIFFHTLCTLSVTENKEIGGAEPPGG